MLRTTNLIGGAVFRPDIEISNTASATDASDLTTYTFSSQSLGAAESNRLIVVGVVSRVGTTGRTLDTVTIGGTAATAIINTNVDVGGGSSIAALFGLIVPTGTTADVVATFSGSMVRAGLGVWRIMGLTSTTAFDTQNDTAGDPLSMSLDIPFGGVGIGMAWSNNAGGTWTGLTEDFDLAVETTMVTGASLSVAETDTIAITITHGGSSPVSVAASWCNK